MAENKTGKTVEQASDAEIIKQIKSNKILQSIPELEKPEELTLAHAAALDDLIEFNQMAYTRYIQPVSEAEGEVSSDKTVRAQAAFGDIVLNEDKFFRSLAKDAEAFDKWDRGHKLMDMFTAYSLLVSYYRTELGK